jgi:translation initiation factor IF-2
MQAELEETVIEEITDSEEDLKARAPIVTVMGHVDHGKTSLLDYIRKENVIAGESGGITQHIGAYGVTLESGQKISFLDTPGHEAFTAMRARGAQVTDIAIIVVAADDDIMPQTKEAIAHAQAAGVPMVFAINKIDRPTANPDKIKEGLAAMNLLVEDWGGKIQSHDISAKTGQGVNELLEKVLLEAELLELKANPNREASGTVVEAFLDKGRGYVSTVLVQNGTLRIGDYVLAGTSSGKIRAMQDERGKNIKEAGPATPISILGLDGAPQAGDRFNVLKDEREAKQIAQKRSQLQREQSVRAQRQLTLDEIGRRIAVGDFQELNIILKGDVDGSVEALTDSFQKLSTEEIQVNIIHKGVGAITESDVLLASASSAVVIGFNVRPMANARTVAEKEEVDIRTYSIIYDAIDDIKKAMEGMLSPEMKEEVTGTAEIRETFKISKIGTIAGCMVLSGKIFRNSKVRVIRDGVVVFDGELASLKRFKDDVKEVSKGYDCGLQVKNYNDIRVDDQIEAYQEVAVQKKL